MRDRLFESAILLVNVGYIISRAVVEEAAESLLFSWTYLAVYTTLSIFSIKKEQVRPQMLPSALVHTLLPTCLILHSSEMISFLLFKIYYLGSATSIFLFIAFAKSKNLDLHGDYGVGYKDITIVPDGPQAEDYHAMKVAVYYPIDMQLYNDNTSGTWDNDSRMPRWARDGDDTLIGMYYSPYWMIRNLISFNLQVVEDAELANDFHKGKKKLSQVVFSHGINGHRTYHSNTCRELASNGWIVFAVDHTDTSAAYFFNTKEGKKQYYTHLGWEDVQKRSEQVHYRVEEVQCIIDYFSRSEISLFQCDEVIDKHITVAGYSLGGITAIKAAQMDPDRIKAAIALDPWWMPFHNEIVADEIAMSQPLAVISSSRFQKDHVLYHSWELTQKLCSAAARNCATSQHNINAILNSTSHLAQTDMHLLLPNEYRYIRKDHVAKDPYLMHDLSNDLMKDFMVKVGVLESAKFSSKLEGNENFVLHDIAK